jgi:Asp-tRNA(Asn)/Glu-tRNA(Gln) amidotransferase A subunit family amidase
MDAALEQELDAMRKARKTLGGLHGIPVSLKETIFVKVSFVCLPV